MQDPKDDIRQLLLHTAREAFLRKGFKAVSMREISQKSGVGLSNIYNYFESKDELLEAVLKPFFLHFDKITGDNAYADLTPTELYTSELYRRHLFGRYLDIIERFRPEMKLLFFAAKGSRFENYRQTLIDKHTRLGLEYMRRMNEKYPCTNSCLSHFFIHIACMWWVGILEEVASHDELTDSKMEQFISEYVRFGTAGWKAVMLPHTE